VINSADPATSALMLKGHFDLLHDASADPWRVMSRWYEIRKRRLLLAALPDEHYGRVLELGCSTGVLSHELAARSDHLLAVDFSSAAIERARQRLDGLKQVELRCHDITRGIPEGDFDLVVVSEVGYYLTEDQFDRLVREITGSTPPSGQLLLCHWRHQEGDFRQRPEDVHARVLSDPAWQLIISHQEEDFLLHVVSRIAVAAAAGEGCDR
jgi:SAM-dependent methyltransferase